MLCSPEELKTKCNAFRSKWESFFCNPDFDGFVEFAVAASSITGFLSNKGLSGLHQSSHAVEQKLLSLFDQWDAHSMPATNLNELKELMRSFGDRVSAFIHGNSAALVDRRNPVDGSAGSLAPPKTVLVVTRNPAQWESLTGHAGYFNISATTCSFEDCRTAAREPAIVLVDALGVQSGAFDITVKALLGRFSATHIVGVNLPSDFESINNALIAGCEFCFAASTPQPLIIDRIVKLCANEEEAPYRVLVVEDSKTASASIQRTLSEGGIQSMAISRPHDILNSLGVFQPDLILMDMYMPGCTGVGVTRVVRQHPAYLSIPVVYLSVDTNVALQVDALRLGGDHFLTKPFNPVILNAVVNSKIERYRALRRSMFHDSLTGLLNHSAAKQRLDLALTSAAAATLPLSVAMLDIDHFKKVNDTYGHPMGDQVIRSMAWLLRQRLRETDVVGRYGGEEFLVVLPGSDASQAIAMLSSIRGDFGQIRHRYQDTSFVCTFSGGVAQWGTGLTAETLIARADEALYQSKRAGRNQVRSETPLQKGVAVENGI